MNKYTVFTTHGKFHHKLELEANSKQEVIEILNKKFNTPYILTHCFREIGTGILTNEI